MPDPNQAQYPLRDASRSVGFFFPTAFARRHLLSFCADGRLSSPFASPFFYARQFKLAAIQIAARPHS
jgi:hypothetical protein